MIALSTLLAITACSGAVEVDDGFDLSEFSIGGPDLMSEGESSLIVRNHGEFPHTLVVSADDGTVIAASDLIQPGETAEVALFLEEGTYQFTCRIVSQTSDGEIVDHFEEGMVKTVSVQS